MHSCKSLRVQGVQQGGQAHKVGKQWKWDPGNNTVSEKTLKMLVQQNGYVCTSEGQRWLWKFQKYEVIVKAVLVKSCNYCCLVQLEGGKPELEARRGSIIPFSVFQFPRVSLKMSWKMQFWSLRVALDTWTFGAKKTRQVSGLYLNRMGQKGLVHR